LDGGVFERFTERARQVVLLAQQEAVSFGHDHIGTEHLLLGLIREEEGIAARALAEAGVELEAARASVVAILGAGDPAASGQIPFTARGKRALELALREALALGHTWIGTEHLLLGLTRAGDGRATEVLTELDVDPGELRERVVALIGGGLQLASAQRRSIEPARPARRRWDYHVEALGDMAADNALQALGILGADGWELVTVVGEPGDYRGVFKRPR
jgi:ATP-dependent Clp protease ATP-binding subunit ClpC